MLLYRFFYYLNFLRFHFLANVQCHVFFCHPYFVAAEGQYSLVVEKELPPMHLNKEKLDMLEEEFPKEYEEQCNSGTRANYRSDRSERRQPDVMDDQPGKSRSTFLSCHTSVISYAYISSRFGILLKVNEQESKYEY